MRNLLKFFIILLILGLSYSIYSVVKSLYDIRPPGERIEETREKEPVLTPRETLPESGDKSRKPPSSIVSTEQVAQIGAAAKADSVPATKGGLAERPLVNGYTAPSGIEEEGPVAEPAAVEPEKTRDVIPVETMAEEAAVEDAAESPTEDTGAYVNVPDEEAAQSEVETSETAAEVLPEEEMAGLPAERPLVIEHTVPPGIEEEGPVAEPAAAEPEKTGDVIPVETMAEEAAVEDAAESPTEDTGAYVSVPDEEAAQFEAETSETAAEVLPEEEMAGLPAERPLVIEHTAPSGIEEEGPVAEPAAVEPENTRDVIPVAAESEEAAVTDTEEPPGEEPDAEHSRMEAYDTEEITGVSDDDKKAVDTDMLPGVTGFVPSAEVGGITGRAPDAAVTGIAPEVLPAETHAVAAGEDAPEEPVSEGLAGDVTARDAEVMQAMTDDIRKPAGDLPAEESIEKPVEKRVALRPEEVRGTREERIAVYPFENLTESRDAIKDVMPLITAHLEDKGMIIADDDVLQNYLCSERVRSSGFVSRELARKIGDNFVVGTIITGSIVSYSTDENPKFGIIARVIDASDGAILWADYASATGEDFSRILGLGKLRTIYSLIPRVMDRLFSTFDLKRHEEKSGTAVNVAVMPFKNNSKFRNAGKIASYLFLVELFKNHKFKPIEYGSIRELMVEFRVRNKGELDYDSIKAISKPLTAEGILVGVVDFYSNGVADSSPPKVSVTARLINSRDGKILWYNSRELTGENTVIALDWGRIRAADKVAYRAVSGFVEEMVSAEFQ